MRRADTSAPDATRQVASNVSVSNATIHTHVIQTDDPGLRVIITGTAHAKVQHIERLVDGGFLAALPPQPAKVLWFMLRLTNGRWLRENDELVCWPKNPRLARMCAISKGHLKRAIKVLRKFKFVEPAVIVLDGKTKRVHKLCVPPDLYERSTFEMSGRKATKKGAHARPQGSAHARPQGSAHARHRNIERETKGGSEVDQTIKPSTTPTLITGADLEGVVGEMRSFEIGEDTIRSLLQLPTSTLANVKAAIEIARKRPPEHRGGKCVKLLQNASNIPRDVLDRAESRSLAKAADDAELVDADQVLAGLSEEQREELFRVVEFRKIEHAQQQRFDRDGVDPRSVPWVRKLMVKLLRSDTSPVRL